MTEIQVENREEISVWASLRSKASFILAGIGLASQLVACVRPGKEVNAPMELSVDGGADLKEGGKRYTEEEISSYPREESEQEYKNEFFCSDGHRKQKKLEEERALKYALINPEFDSEVKQCEVKEKEGYKLLKKLQTIYNLMFAGHAHDPELKEQEWKTLETLANCLTEEWAIEGLIKISHEAPEGKVAKLTLAEILAENVNPKVIERVKNYLDNPEASPSSISDFIQKFGHLEEFEEKVHNFAMKGDTGIRETAIYVLRSPSEKNAEVLLEILELEDKKTGPNEDIQEPTIIALSDQPGEEVTGKLIEILKTGTPYLKNAATKALRGREDQKVTLALMEAFNDPDIPKGTLIDSIGCRAGTEIDRFLFNYIQAEMDEIRKLSEQDLNRKLTPEELEEMLSKIDEHQNNIERTLESIKRELHDHYDDEKDPEDDLNFGQN